MHFTPATKGWDQKSWQADDLNHFPSASRPPSSRACTSRRSSTRGSGAREPLLPASSSCSSCGGRGQKLWQNKPIGQCRCGLLKPAEEPKSSSKRPPSAGWAQQSPSVSISWTVQSSTGPEPDFVINDLLRLFAPTLGPTSIMLLALICHDLWPRTLDSSSCHSDLTCTDIFRRFST